MAEIRKLNDVGIVDGVTTNPTLIAKSGRPIREVLAEICELVDEAGFWGDGLNVCRGDGS